MEGKEGGKEGRERGREGEGKEGRTEAGGNKDGGGLDFSDLQILYKSSVISGSQEPPWKPSQGFNRSLGISRLFCRHSREKHPLLLGHQEGTPVGILGDLWLGTALQPWADADMLSETMGAVAGT